MRLSTTVSTLLILRPVLTQTALSRYSGNSRRAIRHGTGRKAHYWIRYGWICVENMYGSNTLYHLWSEIVKHYPPPPGFVWKCGLIFRLLIGLPYDRPIFGKFLVRGALMQLFFQDSRREREAEYEYKCKISVNAQIHTKLSCSPLTETNHQPPPKVLHHLPLHLIPLGSVTALQTVLRSIASFTSYYCSTLLNKILLKKVKPVHNVSQLFINLHLQNEHFQLYKGSY